MLLKILALTAVLFAAQELLRRSSKWVLWAVGCLVPLALTPYWLTADDFDLFWWVKLYTVLFCCSGWGTAVRFTAVGGRRWARLSIPVLLGVNILMAVTVDAQIGEWSHGMVAVAGLILIATIPMEPGAMRIDPPELRTNFRLSVTRGWVVAYTAWNWAFVYLNYPIYVGCHTAVLAAALILGLADPGLWLQARTCTLALNLLAMATVNAELLAWMDTSNWFDDRATIFVAGIALAATSAGTVRRFRRTLDPTSSGKASRVDRRPAVRVSLRERRMPFGTKAIR